MTQNEGVNYLVMLVEIFPKTYDNKPIDSVKSTDSDPYD